MYIHVLGKQRCGFCWCVFVDVDVLHPELTWWSSNESAEEYSRMNKSLFLFLIIPNLIKWHLTFRLSYLIKENMKCRYVKLYRIASSWDNSATVLHVCVFCIWGEIFFRIASSYNSSSHTKETFRLL